MRWKKVDPMNSKSVSSQLIYRRMKLISLDKYVTNNHAIEQYSYRSSLLFRLANYFSVLLTAYTEWFFIFIKPLLALTKFEKSSYRPRSNKNSSLAKATRPYRLNCLELRPKGPNIEYTPYIPVIIYIHI